MLNRIGKTPNRSGAMQNCITQPEDNATFTGLVLGETNFL